MSNCTFEPAIAFVERILHFGFHGIQFIFGDSSPRFNLPFWVPHYGLFLLAYLPPTMLLWSDYVDVAAGNVFPVSRAMSRRRRQVLRLHHSDFPAGLRSRAGNVVVKLRKMRENWGREGREMFVVCPNIYRYMYEAN